MNYLKNNKTNDFSNCKTSRPKPNGNTLVHDPKKPATLPVPQQILLSKFSAIKTDKKTGRKEVKSYMSERELKLFFFLLHAVFNELEAGKTHKIDIFKAFNALKHEYGINEQSTTWIWESAKNLSNFNIEWVEIINDVRWDSIGTLINYAATSQTDRETGVLKFRFCNELIPLLKEQSRFSRVRLYFIMNLSSRHAIILYGILEGYANYTHTNVFTFDLDLIKGWFKLESNQYKLYANLKNRVLEPAFKQLNKDPKNSGFTASYKPIKRSRKVVSIEITINKTGARITEEEEVKKLKNNSTTNKSPIVETLPLLKLNPEKLKNMAIKQGIRDDLYSLIALHEDDWRNWLYDTGKAETLKCAEASFLGFVKKKT